MCIEAVTSGEAWAALRGRGGESTRCGPSSRETRKRAERHSGRESADRRSGREGGAGDGVNLVVDTIDGLDGDELLELSDRFKQRHTLRGGARLVRPAAGR